MQVTDRISDEVQEWHIGILDHLPTEPVPILPKDNPLALNLQAVFNKTFKSTTLSRALTYEIIELHPPLKDAEEIERMKSFLSGLH